MPLTSKGREIKKNLVEEYGEKHGTEVLFAGKNSGRFTGIDVLSKAIAAGEREMEVQKQMRSMLDGKSVSGRDRARLRR